MNEPDDIEHRDIEAALASRRELGASYDAEIVDGFAERIERAVEKRVSERMHLEQRRSSAVAGGGPRQLALGVVSLAIFIPISIALGVNDKFLPLLVTLAAIVAVNFAHAMQARPR